MWEEDLANCADVRAPTGAGTSTLRATAKVSVAATTTTAQDTGVTGTPQRFVTFVSTVDCYIRFGSAAVAAATSDDWPLAANVPQSFRIHGTAVDRYFTAIRASSDGTLKWYASS